MKLHESVLKCWNSSPKFLNPNCFSNLNSNVLLDLTDLQVHVIKNSVSKTVPTFHWTQINCSTDLKLFANFLRISNVFLDQIFFLTVVQNNFGNKIPLITTSYSTWAQCFTSCNVKRSLLVLSPIFPTLAENWPIFHRTALCLFFLSSSLAMQFFFLVLLHDLPTSKCLFKLNFQIGHYSCIKITTTLIQICHQNFNGFFSNASHHIMV